MLFHQMEEASGSIFKLRPSGFRVRFGFVSIAALLLLLHTPLDEAAIRQATISKQVKLRAVRGYGRSQCESLEGSVNVLEHGAKGDGLANDTDAILSAISGGSGAIILPAGYTFLSWPLKISKPNTTICIQGTLLAPSMDEWPDIPCPQITDECATSTGMTPEQLRVQTVTFLRVENATNFNLVGNGTIEGQGKKWWSLRSKHPARFAPVLVLLKQCLDCRVEGLNLRNSPFYHCVVVDSLRVQVISLNIESPKTSKNTDGVSLFGSRDILVRGCRISTGDDNIVIKEGSKSILIEKCWLLHGHGTSMGSLGEANSFGSIEDVVVRNVVYNSTHYGARIKTWQGGSGFVRNVTFRNLIFEDVHLPVRINQFYCPVSQHPGPCEEVKSAVAISHIRYIGLAGTTSKNMATVLECSNSVPCKDITMAQVSIKRASTKEEKGPEDIWNACNSVYGKTTNVHPPACYNRNGVRKVQHDPLSPPPAEGNATQEGGVGAVEGAVEGAGAAGESLEADAEVKVLGGDQAESGENGALDEAKVVVEVVSDEAEQTAAEKQAKGAGESRGPDEYWAASNNEEDGAKEKAVAASSSQESWAQEKVVAAEGAEKVSRRTGPKKQVEGAGESRGPDEYWAANNSEEDGAQEKVVAAKSTDKGSRRTGPKKPAEGAADESRGPDEYWAASNSEDEGGAQEKAAAANEETVDEAKLRSKTAKKEAQERISEGIVRLRERARSDRDDKLLAGGVATTRTSTARQTRSSQLGAQSKVQKASSNKSRRMRGKSN